MAKLTYTVPTQYQGKSLSQLRNEQNLAFRPDILAGFANTDQNTPLGASLMVDLPENYAASGESQGLQRLFGTGLSQAETLNQQQRSREEDFLTRFRTSIPEARTAIESELGLPGLRSNALAAGETARNVQNQFGAIAPTQQTVAKQVGISAPRLQQRISSKTAELAPALSAASSSLSGANEALTSGLTTYGTRMGETMKPFETEASVLSESLAREFTGFTNQMKNELDITLEKLKQQGTLDLAEIQKATALAEKEQEYENQRATLNLGNRQVIINPVTGKEISSFATGLSPVRGGTGTTTPDPKKYLSTQTSVFPSYFTPLTTLGVN